MPCNFSFAFWLAVPAVAALAAVAAVAVYWSLPRVGLLQAGEEERDQAAQRASHHLLLSRYSQYHRPCVSSGIFQEGGQREEREPLMRAAEPNPPSLTPGGFHDSR